MSNHENTQYQFVQEEQSLTPRGAPEKFLLFHFPTLEAALTKNPPSALAQLRTKLNHTCQELERVIRQGSNQDAKAAQHALQAWQITLKVLTELETGTR